MAKRSAAERFWSKVDKTGPAPPDPWCPVEGGCWLWTASKIRGYGSFQAESRRGVRAHRWAYEALVGPIPEGLQLDHLCRVRNCVNPAHMEPVTSSVNTLRGATIPASNAAKTKCPMGHEYTPENTYRRTPSERECRTCRREESARRRLAARTAP